MRLNFKWYDDGLGCVQVAVAGIYVLSFGVYYIPANWFTAPSLIIVALAVAAFIVRAIYHLVEGEYDGKGFISDERKQDREKTE